MYSRQYTYRQTSTIISYLIKWKKYDIIYELVKENIEKIKNTLYIIDEIYTPIKGNNILKSYFLCDLISLFNCLIAFVRTSNLNMNIAACSLFATVANTAAKENINTLPKTERMFTI